MSRIGNKVIVVNYRYDDKKNERVVDPSNRELGSIADWMNGDDQLRMIMSQAGLIEIAVSYETFGLSDLLDWSPKND